MIFRRSISDLIQREAPGGPGDPPADWREQQAAKDAALAHSNSELDKARKEAASYRVGNRGAMAEAARRLAAAAGVELPPDTPPDLNSLIDQLDPAKHAEALKAKDDSIRGLKLRATLSENFHRLGMKPGLARAALLDAGHMEKLAAAVDAPDFDEQVNTVLEELAVVLPEVRGSGPIPTRSSAQMRHAVNVDEQFGIEEVNAMTPEEVQAALSRGKLDRLLNRRS